MNETALFLAGVIYGAVMQFVWMTNVPDRLAKPFTRRWILLVFAGAVPVCGSWVAIAACIRSIS